MLVQTLPWSIIVSYSLYPSVRCVVTAYVNLCITRSRWYCPSPGSSFSGSSATTFTSYESKSESSFIGVFILDDQANVLSVSTDTHCIVMLPIFLKIFMENYWKRLSPGNRWASRSESILTDTPGNYRPGEDGLRKCWKFCRLLFIGHFKINSAP